ncbi:MAG: hypothetical protein WKF37_20495, partial [Bryobacteraceae bacterium]
RTILRLKTSYLQYVRESRNCSLSSSEVNFTQLLTVLHGGQEMLRGYSKMGHCLTLKQPIFVAALPALPQ